MLKMGKLLQKKNLKITSFIVLILILTSLTFIECFGEGYKNSKINIALSKTTSSWIKSSTKVKSKSKISSIKRFTSKEEFKKYLEASENLFGIFMLENFAHRTAPSSFYFEAFTPLEAPVSSGEAKSFGGEYQPERISETTIQVPGIDEPDIVKTDGKEIYFSPYRYLPIWRAETLIEDKISPYYKKVNTKIIKAFPPSDLNLESEIDKLGNLILVKNILIIFSDKEIIGYDVSNPKSPIKKWEIKLEEENEIVASRLYNEKIYLVTKNSIDKINPCPIEPLIIGEKPLKIKCEEVYHPISPIPTDVIFTAMILNPITGQIENKIAFIGASDKSVVYMSKNAIYITYSYYESILKIYYQFLKERCEDIVPNWVIEKLGKLETYDISQAAKLVEMEVIFTKFLNSLSAEKRQKIENDLTNRILVYYKEKAREFEKSGIVKIGVEKFEIESIGNVPGFPLNQFSLDEYQDTLRIAVTIGGGRTFDFGSAIFIPSTILSSINDVYILDNKNLQIIGKIQNLGLTERIYSVRFVEDKGYVVTFRETDPFYVLDLSNPRNPQLKGELKIPGYSSYLHPITKDKILGIGKEGWQVKMSLFDVSSPEKPKELDKYILDESWSDILSTHHAFLLDKKHEIFFLPGARSAYVFSYKNDKLDLIKVVSDISARRAIYINDYLYVIGDDKITVLDEDNWKKIKEIEI